jgi:hypothetical protein
LLVIDEFHLRSMPHVPVFQVMSHHCKQTLTWRPYKQSGLATWLQHFCYQHLKQEQKECAISST